MSSQSVSASIATPNSKTVTRWYIKAKRHVDEKGTQTASVISKWDVNNRYDTPDMWADIDLKKVDAQFNALNCGDKLKAYWVDQREWRPAVVLQKYTYESGIWILLGYPQHPFAQNECWNLREKSHYNRLRWF